MKQTPKVRFEAWDKYRILVDREVKRLERAYEKEIDTKIKEEYRNMLNDMYHTQYDLEHNTI